MARKPRPPHKIGRKRRAAGWTLLALGVIVAAVWVASRWWSVDGPRTSLGEGRLYWRTGAAPVNHGIYATSWELSRQSFVPPFWDWWYGWSAPTPNRDVFAAGIYKRITRPSVDGGIGRGHYLILWPIPLLLWTPAALLLRSGIVARRRAMSNACAKCGYSLAGLAKDAPCPECGKGAAST